MTVQLNPVDKKTLAEVRRWLVAGHRRWARSRRRVLRQLRVGVRQPQDRGCRSRARAALATVLPAQAMTAAAKRRGPRIALQWRVTFALVVIVLIPFALSYVLRRPDRQGRGELQGERGPRVASRRWRRRSMPYRDLFETTKRLHADIADRLAHAARARSRSIPRPTRRDPDEEVAAQSHLRALALLRDDGDRRDRGRAPARYPPAGAVARQGRRSTARQRTAPCA